MEITDDNGKMDFGLGKKGCLRCTSGSGAVPERPEESATIMYNLTPHGGRARKNGAEGNPPG